MDISKFLDNIDQEDYDRWIEGKKSICSLVKQHRLTALLFKRRIINAIEEYEPDDLICKFSEECPEIDLRSEGKARERVQEELEEIKRIL
ncbi:MAG: hypothetical protein ACOC89_00055 [Candidatus Saliniplasma sp.]